jgi:hypothetical protein
MNIPVPSFFMGCRLSGMSNPRKATFESPEEFAIPFRSLVVLDGEPAASDCQKASKASPQRSHIVDGQVNVDRTCDRSDKGAGDCPSNNDKHVSH